MKGCCTEQISKAGLTLKIESLREFVKDFQKEVVMLTKQVPNGLLSKIWAKAQKSGHLLCLWLLLKQVNALQKPISTFRVWGS